MSRGSEAVIAMRLRTRFQTGLFWNALAALAVQGSTFLVSLIVSNLIGKTGFGEFSMVYATMIAAAGIAQVATGITASKYVAEFRDVEKDRAGRVIALCSLVSLIGGGLALLTVVVSAPWLAAWPLSAPHVASVLTIGAGFLFFTVLNGYQQGALVGLEAYRRLAWVSMSHAAIHVAGVAFSTYMWGLTGAVGAITVSAAIRWYLFRHALHREARAHGIAIHYRHACSERVILRRFALPAAIAGISSMPAVWLASAFLVQQPAGYGQLGLFSSANNLKNLVLFLPVLTGQVGQALLNNRKGHRDQDGYVKIFWVNTAAVAGLLLVAVVIVAALGHDLLRLYGTEFADAYPILLVLLLAASLEGVATALYQLVQSQERMWWSLIGIALPRDLVLIIAAYSLTVEYAGLGLAWGFATSAAIGLIATAIAVKRIGFKVQVSV